MVKEWYQICKDCGERFGYSDYSLQQDLKKGLSKPERCPKCRSQHGTEINSIANSHFGLTPRTEKRSILGLPYLGYIEHGERILEDEEKDPDTSGMDLGLVDADHKHIKRVYDALDNHQVVVIVAPTGTGKSTYIPFRLIEPIVGYEKDKFTKRGPIIVTQPRIPAASGIPRAIGEKLLGSNVGAGFEIGFRHGDRSGRKLGEVWDRRNRLLFVTDGTLLNWISEGRIGDYSIIMIDEAHERSSIIDLILGLTKQELLKYPYLKLIIASATIDADSFVKYFSDVTSVKLLDFNDCQKSFGYQEMPWETKEISESDMKARTPNDSLSIEKWLKDYQKNMPEKVAAKILDIINNSNQGGILGFLHGKEEVETAVNLIKEKLKDRDEIKVFPLYTRLGTERINAAIKKFDESDIIVKGKSRIMPRRVIIATNIAETSLTIPDIVYVVDSGLIKQSEWNPLTCRQELKTKVHSKDGCKQRWGRAGRVQKGFAYKMYTKEEFIKYFPDHTPPEITRECLDDIVLTAKASGVQDVNPSKFSWIEKPPTEELNRALNILNERDLVDQDNDMTSDGREVYRISKKISQFLERYDPNSTNRALDVATMLILADKYACLIEAVTALVVMPRLGNSLYWDEGLFCWNKNWDIQSKDYIGRLHNELRLGCIDDLDFACKLFALYEQEVVNLPDDIADFFSKRYFINENNFEIVKSAREIILGMFTQGKRLNGFRPIDFLLVERVRMLMAIAWPDRIASIKKGNPLKFAYSKTNTEGIISENGTGDWVDKEKAIIAMMDTSDIVINGSKKGAPVANFIIQAPNYIQSKNEVDIVHNIELIRDNYSAQNKWRSLYAHLFTPIGTNVEIDSSSNQLNIERPILPDIYQPKLDESKIIEEENEFDSSELYGHEIKAKPLSKIKRNKNSEFSNAAKEMIKSTFGIKIKWSNSGKHGLASVENWSEINGEPIAILSSTQTESDYDEFIKAIKDTNKIDLILKRPIIDMLSKKIVGYIVENERGIAFPISTENLSIEQNNPGLYRLKMRKLGFRILKAESSANILYFSLLPELELDLIDLIKKREIEAYVERITTEQIHFSIIRNNDYVHSAKQPLTYVAKFLSELSIGEKVILSIESLIENKGSINIGLRRDLSPEEANSLTKYGIRMEKNQLVCDKPISYEELRTIRDLLPEISSDLRGLYALSHQLRVNVIEVCRVFEALQKRALGIRKMAIANDSETRTMVKELQQEMKSTNVPLSSNSKIIIRDILNDAWNLSFLPEKIRRLSEARLKLQHLEAGLAKNMSQLENARNYGNIEHEQRVIGWINETSEKISRKTEDIRILADEIAELKKLEQDR